MLMYVALSTLLVVANAGLLPVSAPATHLIQTAPLAYAAPAHTLHQIEEHHSPAQYDFSYSVNDPQTGDIKEQHESRQGDNVQGEYSLVEPDGQRRTVQYTADALNGFNAVVLRDGVSQHSVPVAAAAVAPVAVTLAHRAAAPVATIAHAAPIAYTTQQHLSAPVAYTQKIATPVTTYHAQPQITYTQQATPVAYAQHPAATGIAYTQHHQVAAPIAYTQHHQVAAPVAYTQHHQLVAPVAYAQHHQLATPIATTYAAATPVATAHLATSHATVSHGTGVSYAY